MRWPLQMEVDQGIDSCKYSIYMVPYGGGTLHASRFNAAMSKPWECILGSFKMYVPKDNIFLVFHKFNSRDLALNKVSWNFDKKLLIIHPWIP